MKTVFPYSCRIPFDQYLERYLAREDAIRSIPSDQELEELALQGIVKDRLQLQQLPGDTPAEEGDVAVVATASELPRYNKPKVTVTLGRGLYNKKLERALVGKRVGESCRVFIDETPVSATLLELRRKVVPQPTDEMVEQLHQTDLHNQPIHTVAEYKAYIKEQKITEVLSTVNYYVMTDIMQDYPITEFAESDLERLGELEADTFCKLFQEQEGIDLRKEVPASWQEDMGVHSLEEFIQARREWYQSKIQQCLILLNILGLPCEGKTDPLDHYEVLSELQDQMFQKIKAELERRTQK